MEPQHAYSWDTPNHFLSTFSYSLKYKDVQFPCHRQPLTPTFISKIIKNTVLIKGGHTFLIKVPMIFFHYAIRAHIYIFLRWGATHTAYTVPKTATLWYFRAFQEEQKEGEKKQIGENKLKKRSKTHEIGQIVFVHDKCTKGG